MTASQQRAILLARPDPPVPAPEFGARHVGMLPPSAVWPCDIFAANAIALIATDGAAASLDVNLILAREGRANHSAAIIDTALAALSFDGHKVAVAVRC